MQETKGLDFSGQAFYAGIDTHKTNWKVTVRSNGLTLKTFSMNPSPLELYRYMSKSYPGGTFYSVYEAGFSGFWIDRTLRSMGIRNIIVNPSDVPTTNKEKDRKSDPIDSNKLSRELSNGSLKGIYVPDPYMESIRVLSRSLRQYSIRSTQVKNRIKGLLHFIGVGCEFDSYKHWSRAYLRQISEYTFSEDNVAFVIKNHLSELEHLREMRLTILRRIRVIAKENAIIKILRTVPGVGLVTAFTLIAELVDIKRFTNLNSVASFVGLVPSTASSDKKEIVRGMTNRHCRYLRYMLIESAWIAVRKDPVLTQSFNKHCQKMQRNRAIIRIAKKMLNRIRAVWLTQKGYAIGTIETIPCQKVNKKVKHSEVAYSV
jgi:transposase